MTALSIFRWAAVCLTVLVAQHGMTVAWAGERPVRVIFDTDIGNDVDDSMALAVIHALADRAECELLAVTVTKDNQYAGPMIDLLNTFYGRGEIPIGVVRDGVTPEDGRYLKPVVTANDDGELRYPHDLARSSDAPAAVALLREVLSAQPDESVVMLQVGFSTNLARLLASKPDAHSSLDGESLVAKKVKLLSIMAGSFHEKFKPNGGREYNIVRDLPASKDLFAHWPTPLVASGWEIGHLVRQSAAGMQNDYGYVEHHPVQEAYRYYRGLDNSQPLFDLTSVLYAVRPDRDYFTLSPAGVIRVMEDGRTEFEADPQGKHRYLIATPAQVARSAEALELLTSQPPRR